MGSIIRLISGNKLLKYPDEIEFPSKYTSAHISRVETHLSMMIPRGADREGQRRVPDLERPQSRPHPGDNDVSAAEKGLHERQAATAPSSNPRTGSANPATEKPSTNGQKRDTPPYTPIGMPSGEEPERSDSEDTVTGPTGQRQALGAPAAKKQSRGLPQAQSGEREVQQSSGYQGGESHVDPNLVTWYGPDDPENP